MGVIGQRRRKREKITWKNNGRTFSKFDKTPNPTDPESQ